MQTLTKADRNKLDKIKSEIIGYIAKYTTLCKDGKDAFESLDTLFNGYARDEFDNTTLFDFQYKGVCATIIYNARSKKVTLGKTCDIISDSGEIVRSGYHW